MNHRYIAFEGNIGSGKTTIGTKMATSLDARLILEEFNENPFLPLFYQKPSRYAFSLEMAFLADRYHQLQQYAAEDLFQTITLADYSIYKSLIFAQNNLNGHELVLYKNLFEIIAKSLKQPDLVIYFNRPVSTLQQHIKKRNRPYEQNIGDEYLQDIQARYTEFFKQNDTIPVAVIEADNYDFINSGEDFEQLQNIMFQNYSPGLNFIP